MQPAGICRDHVRVWWGVVASAAQGQVWCTNVVCNRARPWAGGRAPLISDTWGTQLAGARLPGAPRHVVEVGSKSGSSTGRRPRMDGMDITVWAGAGRPATLKA